MYSIIRDLKINERKNYWNEEIKLTVKSLSLKNNHSTFYNYYQFTESAFFINEEIAKLSWFAYCE